MIPVLFPDSGGRRLQEFNTCHEPGGKATGGQFCSKDVSVGAYPEQGDTVGWEQWWQREKLWNRKMTDAVSLGHISPKDAEVLGWRPEDSSVEYEALPETLYHVSTAAEAILRQGVKTRSEIGGVHRGLGGGTDQAVSFTADLKTARAIRAAMLEARRVVRGEITPAQMLRMARAQPVLTPQTGAAKYMQSQGRRSAEEMLLSLYAGKEWHHGDPMPESLDRLLRGVVQERPTDSKDPALQAATAQAKAEGLSAMGALPSRLIPKGMTIVSGWQGRDEPFAGWVERPMTQQEKIDGAWEMYRRYATAREHAGGRLDPLFFMTDIEALAKVPVKDIKILKFRPRKGARGYKVSALGEWRVNTGRAVRFDGIAEAAR